MKKDIDRLRLFGIFGNPLAHTLSPAMQEAAFEHIGWKAHYLALELNAQDFRKAMAGLARFPVEGFNLTLPYKQAVMPYLDALTPEARAVGAVNTVFRRGRRWVGTNTDVYGFLRSLREEGHFKPKKKKILILGAGGAARGVIYGLAKSGAREIRVANRPQFAARRKKLVLNFKKIFPKVSFAEFSISDGNKLKQALNEVDLVVNATSVGVVFKTKKLIPNFLIPQGKKGRGILFFDLVYHRRRTPFLKAAERKGHKILGGLGMLLFQGARAFEHWTGKKAPVKVMRRVLEKTLKERHE